MSGPIRSPGRRGGSALDLRRQIGVVRSWFWLFVAGVLLAGGTAFLVSVNLPRVYEAKATLIVGQSLSAVNPDYNQLLASQRLSQTYADVATTRPILERVDATLNLGLTTDDLLAKVRADAPRDSTLLVITASDSNPETAAKIANAIAAELLSASPALQGQQTNAQAFVSQDLRNVQGQIQTAQAEADRLTNLPARTADQDQQLATVQSQLITLRSTYATLLQLNSNSASNLLSIVEPATGPAAPSSPRPLLNTVFAALVGLIITIGIAFTFEYLDDTVKTSLDVEETTGLPTLGAVGKMKGDRKRKEFYRLVTLLYPRSGTAEAYRSLRTNVEFTSVDHPLRTLVVTSSIPSEGKTVTASNLAVAFAQAGRRVFLVDCDLRKPGVHRIFDLPNTSGLTTLLRSDQLAPDAVAQPTEQDGLRIITTGPLPPNPAELLGSQRFLDVLGRIVAACDLVMLDSPPLQAVADAAILSAVTDGTLLVIDAGRTRRGAARQGREALAKANARVLGVTLNRLSGRVQDEYYYYRGYYGAEDSGDGRSQPGGDVRPPAAGAGGPPGIPVPDPGGDATR